MSGSFQNKLQKFEVAPPPSVWAKIAQQLDEEFVASDLQIASRIEDASIPAPVDMWDKINAELNGDLPVQEKPARVVPLFRRIAVAAVVLGLLLVGGLYFLNSNKTENNIVQTVPDKTEPVTATEQPKKADTNNNSLIAVNDSPALKKETGKPLPKPRTAVIEDYISITDSKSSSTDYIPNPEQAPLYDLQTVSALQPVSVSAPPLRDKKGNIILDASLISNPDAEYITVTGPNGKQTKISSKFLSCLSYINANLTSNDGDTRAIRCKTQFEEWRKKILAQPAFIPTANNFFDIFELKDLLQEM